ncbi:acetolactate decarboxylase [Lactobacillus selangorensis]|nr:acetolactate decarboxylase [Lactobacillus selangorensis]
MKKTKVLYQHGTLALLVPGLFAGTETLGKLLEHGDTGIGTLDGLNGELIILDGKVYQVNATGKVNRIKKREKVPFANVHYQKDQFIDKIGPLKDEKLRSAILDKLPSQNLFYAVRMTGEFANVKTRAVAQQKEPYPTLKQTADAQKVFEKAHVKGTLIGYYAPQLYGGVAVPGFHLHFLSKDHSFGGHVLKVDSVATKLYLQEFAQLDLHLPAKNKAFRKQKPSKDILKDIASAEN